MKVLEVRNVHHALQVGMPLLADEGIRGTSRNGPVIAVPYPVTTIYHSPLERVLFWPQRDANPFFHLYESLWMLGGRNDLAPLTRYVKTFAQFSDDGETLWGAYGFRWRKWFGVDQLEEVIQRLRKDPNDRRAVIGMWDPKMDLTRAGKDLPCNMMISVQVVRGRLDITVFCRSNDIIWGAYGANAVHFSFLQEYLAVRIGVPVGIYYQVSVNWHAYPQVFDPLYAEFKAEAPKWVNNPYFMGGVRTTPMSSDPDGLLDQKIVALLAYADGETTEFPNELRDPWANTIIQVFDAFKHRDPSKLIG